MSGKVYLVGAGPGDPELLTLKALRLLRSADVVLHDELISPEILKLVPQTTLLRNVGKRGGRKNIRQQEIDILLVQYALLDLQVVRLKGGDPLIFGRAGEEIEALRRANIDFEIVSGISSMLGAAAAVQIPLTHRECSSALVVLTGHGAAGNGLTGVRPANWPKQISPGTTVAVFMPGYEYAATSNHLIAAGLEPSTPCVIISKAASASQEIYLSSLRDLHSAPHLSSPTLLIVGDVVRFARQPSLLRKIAAFGSDAQFVPVAPSPAIQDGELSRAREAPE